MKSKRSPGENGQACTRFSFHAIGEFVASALTLCALVLFSNPASATPLSDLEAHLNAFLSGNYPSNSYIASVHETISGSSDKVALGDLIVDNFWVVDQSDDSLTQLSGSGLDEYKSTILVPKMVNGAIVAKIGWTWGAQNVTAYALVSPGPSSVGDTENIIEGVGGFFTVEEPALRAANPFHKGFENGFGMHVADYDASLTCFNGDTCSGTASCNEARPGCGCKRRTDVECLANGNCQMQVAFVGYCGFPAVSFKKDDFEFSVDGWGWTYYNASLTLDAICNCVQNVPTLSQWGLIALCILLILIGTLAIRRRKDLPPGAVTGLMVVIALAIGTAGSLYVDISVDQCASTTVVEAESYTLS